jgi:hypothetical protein
MVCRSEDPADLSKTTRLLTIMLANEHGSLAAPCAGLFFHRCKGSTFGRSGGPPTAVVERSLQTLLSRRRDRRTTLRKM